MTKEEYLNIIAESNVEDWEYDDSNGIYVYLNDISITMCRVYDEEERDFWEDWTDRFSDPHATRQVIELMYNGAIVGKFYTVSVDGGRMNIPFPVIGTHQILIRNYRIGRIVNLPECAVVDDYDRYIRQGGLTIRG